jgi:hypothetical protein
MNEFASLRLRADHPAIYNEVTMAMLAETWEKMG